MQNLTTDYLKQKFDEFNSAYFEGKLNTPDFEITKHKSYGGQYSYRYNLNGDLVKSIIRISVYYQRTEYGYCNILLHEMIHLYIRQNHIKDTRKHHGKVFFSIADRINNSSEWNITHYCDSEGLATDTKQEFVVCAFEHPCNKYFLFVISKQKIDYYLDWFDRTPLHFKNPKVFISTNATEFSSYRTCRTRIYGRYKNTDEFNKLFGEKTKLIHDGVTLSIYGRVG